MTVSEQRLKPILAFPNNTTNSLKQRLDAQLRLLETIKRVLPGELAEHVEHCVVSKKKLLIFTDSAAWAAQLRFYAERLINVSRNHWEAPIITAQVKILPPNKAQGQRRSVAFVPDKSIVYDLQQLSGMSQSDELATALLKLSKTLEKLSSNST